MSNNFNERKFRGTHRTLNIRFDEEMSREITEKARKLNTSIRNLVFLALKNFDPPDYVGGKQE